jgi:gliding motility-associated-like protein
LNVFNRNIKYLKTAFFFGILVVFLYSNVVGNIPQEPVSDIHQFSSQPENKFIQSNRINFDDQIFSRGSLVDTLIIPGINSLIDNKAKSQKDGAENWNFNDGVETYLINAVTCNPGYILAVDTALCYGNIIELESRTALTYKWSPSIGLNDSTIQSPYFSADSARTYYLTTTNYSGNLITNSDFELGNTGFITDYTFCDGINCLKPLGDDGYSVGKDANYFHSYFSGKDHTTGSGNFMIVNGAQPLLTVWQQTVTVKPYTKYAFGAWISTMISLSPAQIKFMINGIQIGELYDAPKYADKWDQVFATWTSGSSPSATIKIVDILPILEGNDFGLDDLFFGEIVTCSDSVKFTVSKNVNLGPDTTIYPGKPVTISPLNGPFDKYAWNIGNTTPDVTINDAGKYWLQVTDKNGCKSVDTINVDDSRFFISFPNAFSPNADGVNDVFRPKVINVTSFHMSVFDRWGKFLFETNDIIAGWYGSIADSKCPEDLYLYIATYQLKDIAGTKSTRGSFMLIR